MLKTAFWEDFFEKKEAISTKSGGTALGKSACEHGWGWYLCQVQNEDIQTVPLDDYQKVVVENSDLKQRIAWFERVLFGRKSERFVRTEELPGQLSMVFDPGQDQVVEQSVRQMVEAHERRVPEKKEDALNGRVLIPADLQRVEEVIEPEEDVSDMKCIGQDVTEVMEYEPGRIWVRRIVRPKYARAKTSEETSEGQIVQAPAKDRPFGRSKAGVSLIAHILISKYVEHLPLHRLIARFARSGLKIAPATMGQMMQHSLTFITVDDLDVLFDEPDIYVAYKTYLQQDPDATQEEKTTAVRMIMFAPKYPINNLSNRLNCFDLDGSTNLNKNHKVTLYVDQPKANSDQSSGSDDKAGHTWLNLEQVDQNGVKINLSVGFYPADFASPCKQIDAGAVNNDAGHAFDISITFEISSYAFTQMVNGMKSSSLPLYN